MWAPMKSSWTENPRHPSMYLSAYGRFRTGPKGDDFDTTVGVTFDRFATKVFGNSLKVYVWASWGRPGSVSGTSCSGLGGTERAGIKYKFSKAFSTTLDKIGSKM